MKRQIKKLIKTCRVIFKPSLNFVLLGSCLGGRLPMPKAALSLSALRRNHPNRNPSHQERPHALIPNFHAGSFGALRAGQGWKFFLDFKSHRIHIMAFDQGRTL